MAATKPIAVRTFPHVTQDCPVGSYTPGRNFMGSPSFLAGSLGTLFPKGSPRGQLFTSIEPLPFFIDSPRGSLVDSPRGFLIDSPRGFLIDSPRSFLIDSPRGSLIDSPRGSLIDSPRGSLIDREVELCRNYTCCGIHLQDLHALHEHFENVHVIVADPNAHAVETDIPYVPVSSGNNLQSENWNGMWTVSYSPFGAPSSLTYMPAMTEFRNTLRAAHPTTCRGIRKCGICVSCKTIPSFQKLLTTPKLPPDTNKQQLFDAAVRELAEIAAKEGLKFEIPVIWMDGREPSSPSLGSGIVTDVNVNGSGIVDSDAGSRHDSGSDSTSILFTSAPPIKEKPLSSLNLVPKFGRLFCPNYPRSFMVNAIKTYLTKLLEDLDIPLGGVTRKQLPWTTLPKVLSERGWQLENWPTEVPLPGSGSQFCNDNKGVNGLATRHLTMLYEATKSIDRPLKFVRIPDAPSAVSVSADYAKRSTKTFDPGSTDSGGELLNVPHRRERENDVEGNQRADKRRRLKGD